MDERRGYLIPTVLLTLVFVVCCGILTGVFLKASAVSRRAGIYNDSVQLCRNQAEQCRAAGIPEGITTYRYDENLQPAEDGLYRITVEGSASGDLQAGIITAEAEGQTVYTLEVAVCLPEGRLP